jgi:hypothetical protein
MSKKVLFAESSDTERKHLHDKKEDASPIPSIIRDSPILEEPVTDKGSSRKLIVGKSYKEEEKAPVTSCKIIVDLVTTF